MSKLNCQRMDELESNQESDIEKQIDSVVQKPENPICNFWLRLLALLIDIVVLIVNGNILGYLFGNFFLRMRGWELFVGFIFSLQYFGFLNSSLSDGQTIGKKIMHIKVVDKHGKPILPWKSVLRSLILIGPFFLSRLKIPSLFFNFSLSKIFYLLIFGGYLGIIYFYIFNKGTRQSLHDLVCGTYVVKRRIEGKAKISRIAQAHYIVFSMIVIILLVFSSIFERFILKKTEFPELIKLMKELNEMDNVVPTGVYAITAFEPDGNKQTLRVSVMWRGCPEPDSLIAVGNRVAAHILYNYPYIEEKDKLWLIMQYGYDIGLISRFYSEVNIASPDKWRKQLNIKKWQEFISQEGRFSVLMPGVVNEQLYNGEAKSPNGPSEFHSFLADNMNIDFLVAYRDYPDSYVQGIKSHSLQERVQNGIVAGFKGRIIFEGTIYLEEFRGKEIMAISQDRKTTMRFKIFLVENRLYLVSAEFPKGNEYSEDVEKFMSTFNIIGKK